MAPRGRRGVGSRAGGVIAPARPAFSAPPGPRPAPATPGPRETLCEGGRAARVPGPSGARQSKEDPGRGKGGLSPGLAGELEPGHAETMDFKTVGVLFCVCVRVRAWIQNRL